MRHEVFCAILADTNAKQTEWKKERRKERERILLQWRSCRDLIKDCDSTDETHTRVKEPLSVRSSGVCRTSRMRWQTLLFSVFGLLWSHINSCSIWFTQFRVSGFRSYLSFWTFLDCMIQNTTYNLLFEHTLIH